MKWTAVAAAGAVLIGIFIAIAVSVVDARRPLDRKVNESFDAVASRLGGARSDVVPVTCRKQRLYYYTCFAEVHVRGRSEPVGTNWQLVLHDDGCWVTPRMRPVFPASSVGAGGRIGLIHGCLAP